MKEIYVKLSIAFISLICIMMSTHLYSSAGDIIYNVGEIAGIEPYEYGLGHNDSYDEVVIPDPYQFNRFTHTSILSDVLGHKYWLGVTTYPYVSQEYSRNQKFEIPCLYYSDDGINFQCPDSMVTPVVMLSPRGYRNSAYLSDSEIVYVPDTNEIYYYYVVGDVHTDFTVEDVKMKKYDGATLSEEINIPYIHGVSPSVIYENGTFWMWITEINERPHTTIRYESKDGINFVNRTVMEDVGLHTTIWHQDILYNEYDRKYYMLITCGDGDGVWIAGTSKVSEQFNLSQSVPVVRLEDLVTNGEPAVSTYRSSGVFTSEKTGVLWVSHQLAADHMWHIAKVEIELRDGIWQCKK